jgi:hypothetical protein
MIDQHWIGAGEVDEFKGEVLTDTTEAPTAMPTLDPTDYIGDTSAPTTAPTAVPTKELDHGYSLPYSMPAAVDDPDFRKPQNDAYPTTPFPTGTPSAPPTADVVSSAAAAYDRGGIAVAVVDYNTIESLPGSATYGEILTPAEGQIVPDQMLTALQAPVTETSLLLLQDGAATVYTSPGALEQAGTISSSSYGADAVDPILGDDLLDQVSITAACATIDSDLCKY